MSPELIKGEGAGFESDWWTFGILLYELSVGKTPFESKEPNELFNLIVKGNYNKSSMSHLSYELSDLIVSLIVLNPQDRLTTKVKEHAFFRKNKVNFDQILSKSIKPPFIPKINHSEDTKYFDTEFLNMKCTDSCNFEDIVNINDDPFLESPLVLTKSLKSRNKQIEEFELSNNIIEEKNTNYLTKSELEEEI